MTRLRSVAILVIAAGACVTARPSSERADSRVNVVVVSDESDAALDILKKLARSEIVDSADWQRLTDSEGYRKLHVREAAMGRAFTDSSFRAFLTSDTLRRRLANLEAVLPRYRNLDVRAAAAQALSYLPPGARIVARLYPMIKPKTNTFVFTSDSVRGIFLYVDPKRTAAQELNTITHELHHIGYSTVCDGETQSTGSPALQMLRQRMFAFGEGLAMLAAAGAPDVHPHAASDTADRNRWDRDIEHVGEGMRDLSEFFSSVADGRITSPDSVLETSAGFYGVQGPWYTVGWKMSVVIEKTFGRAKLIECFCDQRKLLATYNEAAAKHNQGSTKPVALWSKSLAADLRR
jgi:hypothetical protein